MLGRQALRHHSVHERLYYLCAVQHTLLRNNWSNLSSITPVCYFPLLAQIRQGKKKLLIY